MYNGVARSRVHPRLILHFLLLALALSACRGAPKVVKIGLVAPFEGRQRSVGYDAVYAARLAVREANALAAATSLHVELVALDDSGDAELARQAAAALVVDSQVVAVVGHWHDETTAAQKLYADNNLAHLTLGAAPFEAVDPRLLPDDFRQRYAAVTPFDEVAGPQAGATYDAMQLLFVALELAETRGQISRESVAVSLEAIQYQGVTGPVFQP